VAVRETVNATKERFGEQALEALFADGSKVVVGKGKRSLTFDLKQVSARDPEFVAAVLGPTGNLRAPTARVGKNWLVGFHEGNYSERFGQ